LQRRSTAKDAKVAKRKRVETELHSGPAVFAFFASFAVVSLPCFSLVPWTLQIGGAAASPGATPFRS